MFKIKRNQTVVSKLKFDSLTGEPEIFEERTVVEKATAEYFTQI